MSRTLDNLLNNDVVDIIYIKLHNSYMKDLIHEIGNYSSVFETLILNNKNPIRILEKKHNVTLDMEKNIYGRIYVIMIDDNQFITYHKSDDNLIIHGFIERDRIKIERIGYRHNLQIYHSIKDITFTNCNPILYVENSILYVEELFDYKPGELQIDLNYESGKKWQNHAKVYKWFRESFKAEIDYQHELEWKMWEHLELSTELKELQLN